MRIDRTFRFRGTRDYLHSASLFDDILRTRGAAAKNIDMRFHHRTTQQVSYLDTPPSPDDVVVAEWRDSAGMLHVVERDEPIREREPYDEPALADMFGIDDRHVDIPGHIGSFTRIEAIIAGFKRLLHTCRDLPGGARYAFVRVRLQYCPEDAIRIRYARDIGEFFQGDISEGETRIGQIFFGVWQ